jgi:nucleotide-binding universal stress UspA family protein
MIMKLIKVKKVLIAMDYDETSKKVAEEGFSIATAMNAETILLHVVSADPVYYSAYTYMFEFQVEVLNDLKASTQIFLDKVKNHLGDKSIQTVLKEGDIADNILKTAKELDVDIIVVGSHSRKWLESIFLGSQAQDLLAKTTLPLLIVPTRKNE